jgi:hypothetical protein
MPELVVATGDDLARTMEQGGAWAVALTLRNKAV